MSVWATHTGWQHAQAFWLSQVGPLLEGDSQSLAPAGIHIAGISAYLLLLQFMRPYGDDGNSTGGKRLMRLRCGCCKVDVCAFKCGPFTMHYVTLLAYYIQY